MAKRVGCVSENNNDIDDIFEVFDRDEEFENELAELSDNVSSICYFLFDFLFSFLSKKLNKTLTWLDGYISQSSTSSAFFFI